MSNPVMKSIAVATILSSLVLAVGAYAASSNSLKGKNVVLVHGAFADGSSWDKVVPLLEAKGLHVVAVQNPLTSLADDVAATQRVIEQQNGPVVLVGHSWAGVVITQAGMDDKVKALVYIAAIAPDQGQSINDVMEGLPAPAWASQLVKDSAGFVTLPTEAIINQFAQDLPVAEARLVAATQGPWSSKCPGEKVTNAAWHNKPSWDVVTEDDKMISPKLQETMAERIGATVTRVNSSHVVMLSKPEIVAAAIMNAANSIK